MIGCFYAGIAVGWLLHATFTPGIVQPQEPPPRASIAAETAGSPDAPTPGTPANDPVAELRRRDLRVPIDGADVATLQGGFGERRDSGGRRHEAVDILAPRHTPIHAVDNGTVLRLLEHEDGGTTIYQLDPVGRFCYYYAHLERYANGLREGQAIAKGQIIGYVGTTGNAPPNTPHLHFAIFELAPDRKWWEGAPLDPYEVFRRP